MRKGYRAEWEVKKILFKKYSPDSVFKVAIGGTLDFLVLGKGGKIEKIVEVKKTKKKKWYPTEHDFVQYKRLKEIYEKFKIPIEYWIKINGQWKILDLKRVETFFA